MACIALAFDQIERDGIKDPNVRIAVEGLVRVSVCGNSYFVEMPLVYPYGPHRQI